MVEETVTMEGHLIDSDILRKAFARIVEGGGDFEILEFKVGKTNDDPSFLRMSIKAEAPDAVDRILEDLSYLGATAEGPAGRGHGKKRAAKALVENVRFAPAEADGILPDDFYSTTNFDTFVRVDGKWVAAVDQKMDCALVLRDGAPTCVKQGQVRAGEMVALRGAGHPRASPRAQPRLLGVRVHVERRLRGDEQGHRHRGQRARDAPDAGRGREDRGGGRPRHRPFRGGRGPGPPGARRLGGRAADRQRVRDPRPREGDPQDEPRGVPDERPCHRRAAAGITSGRSTRSTARAGSGPRWSPGSSPSGVMYEVVKKGIPFVLAGSIRDDGPLKDVITDTLAAQKAYVDALRGAGMCLMLASALHSIAVGNLLPARVRTVCVDMAESVPVKLSNRGTMQAVGLVTDVGFFLERLESELASLACVAAPGRCSVSRPSPPPRREFLRSLGAAALVLPLESRARPSGLARRAALAPRHLRRDPRLFGRRPRAPRRLHLRRRHQVGRHLHRFRRPLRLQQRLHRRVPAGRGRRGAPLDQPRVRQPRHRQRQHRPLRADLPHAARLRADRARLQARRRGLGPARAA